MSWFSCHLLVTPRRRCGWPIQHITILHEASCFALIVKGGIGGRGRRRGAAKSALAVLAYLSSRARLESA